MADPRYEEALLCYEEVLRLNPGVATVWTNKGYCERECHRLGDLRSDFDFSQPPRSPMILPVSDKYQSGQIKK